MRGKAWRLLLIVVLAISVVGCSSLFWDRLGREPLKKISDTFSHKEGSKPSKSSCEVSPDGLIKTVEVSQVMSYGQDIHTGDMYLMEHFVAGKETAIYVPLSKKRAVDPSGKTQRLVVYKEGEEIATLYPIGKGRTDVLTFMPKELSEVKKWGAGNYTLEVRVGESYGKRYVTFNEAKKIRVLAVPIRGNYGGTVRDVSGEWRTAFKFTRRTYPVANDGIDYVLAPTLDLSGKEYDLYTQKGMYNVWRELKELQTPGDDYELILGFISNRVGEQKTYQGYTFGAPANLVVESDGDMECTVAHEIAHCYNVGDEYEGGIFNMGVNPVPYGMKGRDWKDNDKEVVGRKKFIIGGGEKGSEASGTVIQKTQRPVDLIDKDLNQIVTSFMGSGSNEEDDYWITSAVWEHLYKAFVKKRQRPSEQPTRYIIQCSGCYQDSPKEKYNELFYCVVCEGFTELKQGECREEIVCEQCGEKSKRKEQLIYLECPQCYYLNSAYELGEDLGEEWKPEMMKVIDITGVITQDGQFVPDTWKEKTRVIGGRPSRTEGRYGVYMEDSKGNVLVRHLFEPVYASINNPTIFLEEGVVDLSVKFPDTTKYISIKQGEKEIYRIEVSKHAPEVQIKGIEEGQIVEGQVEVSWEGQDKDGNNLTYSLWYAGDKNAINLLSHTTVTAYTIDFNELPAYDEAYIYVEVSDGIRIGEGRTPSFQVDWKEPLIMTEQEEVQVFKQTDMIALEVDVYDKQDGFMKDKGIVWRDEAGKEVGTSATLRLYPYELEPGTYVFTLVATNKVGKEASKDYKIRVEEDESDLPNDWSREDVKKALQQRYVLPLQEIEEPITRSEFAQIGYRFSASLQEGNKAPYIFDYASLKDCSKEMLPCFYMVSIGVMRGEEGYFYPNKTLTEEEGMIILLQTLERAKPTFVRQYIGVTLQEQLDFLKRVGVLGGEEENAYNPKKMLTKKLALVRIARLEDLYHQKE